MAVERRIELDRRYHRKKKMRKLKAKLSAATGEARDKLLYQIKRLSPWWTEASLTQTQAKPMADAAAPAGTEDAKKKAPPKPKKDKA